MADGHRAESPVAIGVLGEDEPLDKVLAQATQRAATTDGDARVVASLRRAIAASIASHREAAGDALRAAAAARGTELEGELELTTAFVVLESGDATRALGAIARARLAGLSALQRTWASALEIDALAIERGSADALSNVSSIDAELDALGPSSVGLACRVVIARVALDAGRRDLAEAHLRALAGVASRAGLVACDYDVLRAELLLELSPPDAAGARGALSRAVWRLLRLGAPRRLGLAYLAMARVESSASGDPAAPASWLARAQPLLVRAGSTRDQEMLRRAFRLHGRRTLDRLVDADLGTAIDTLRARHARLRDVLAAAHDAREAQAAEVPDEAAALEALERQEEIVIAALESVIVDRERVGQLVRVTQAIARAEGSRAILDALPRLAIDLCAAEGAEVIETTPDGLEVVSRHGAPMPVARARLDREVRETLEEGQPRLFGHETYQPRGGQEGGGRIAVVPLALAAGAGALVVGRTSRGGQINERDVERLTIYGSLAAASLDRARAAEALSEAARRDAATLEAIRDGILTFDEEGAVRSLNRAAARLLRVTREDALGRTPGSLGLGALAAALAPVSGDGARSAEGEVRSAEGEVVALPHGDVLLRARAYEGGVVATLQELQSAQRMAHRLVGGSARFTFADLIGRDPAFREALEAASRAALSDVAILVTGESGTGKELVAQAIHHGSPRASAPFVGINVAAIPRELLESELFGYESGAFTGARSGGMVGKLELAGDGTVLLDEIGDMPWEMQAKLLRVLQERTVVRLGGRREIPIRARIVATTHRDLDVAVREGTFRLDLFYRLRGVHLRLPPLRERRGDVPILVEHYLARIAKREGRPKLGVAAPLMEQLALYDWPGNVRELANLIEGEASLVAPGVTELVHRPAALARALARKIGSEPAAALGPGTQPPASDEVIPLADLEKRAFAHALRREGGNVARAARALGVSRGTFYNKMKLYGIADPKGTSS